MLFNSFHFFYLCSVTLVLYYLPFLKNRQVLLLLLSSLIFYAYHTPWQLILLITCAAINVATSFLITYGKETLQKTWAIIGVVANLSILAFFKYSLLITNIFLDPEASLTTFLIQIPLPIGISFYTFQGISLMVDTYKRNHFEPKVLIPKSIWEHAKRTLFFISFFPQLIAGPIVKAHDFIPQIGVKRLRDIQADYVFKNIILGYFLKIVVADNLKDFTNSLEYPYFLGLSSLMLIVMLVGYSFQIFADFAGYSCIAIGLAGLFGYKLIINFNFPYLATSFRSFWRRWHISLSSFLMEYLYIPLGGSRHGKFRTYFNLFITMILGGLWHGATWSYAVWGFAHGVALAIERFLSETIGSPKTGLYKVTKGFFVFMTVTFAWLLFKLPDFSHVIYYFGALWQNGGIKSDPLIIINIVYLSFPVVIYHIYHQTSQYLSKSVVTKFEYMVYGAMLFFIFTNSGSAGDFIYFQF